MARGDVVVAGAINTDLVAVVSRAPEAGETVTGQSFSVFGGGKGANQAVAACRAGASVALGGAIGDDNFGPDRLRKLAAEGIDVDGVVRLRHQQSGVALIIVEEAGENRIAYIPGPVLAVSAAQLSDLLDRVRPAVYLQPNEVPVPVAKVAMKRARSLGAITLLNAAPDPESVEPLLGDVDFLIVNSGEARALAQREGAAEELVSTLAADTGASVILTAGGTGVFSSREGRFVHVPAPPVDVVDTTGAGDTFCGALAAQLAAGCEFEASLEWAVAAASLATTREGAQPSIPGAAEISRFLAGPR